MARTKRPRGPECVWTHQDTHDMYEAACGEAYCFIADGPRENSYRFCPGCGRKIKMTRRED